MHANIFWGPCSGCGELKQIGTLCSKCNPPRERKLRVIAAAVHHAGLTFSLPPPARHHNVLAAMRDAGVDIDNASCIHGQGFLLSNGCFASRKYAKLVAKEAGQLLPRASGLKELFSEDVW